MDGWKSKQRTKSANPARLKMPINDDNNLDQNDEMAKVAPEFIMWVHKTQIKKNKTAPLSDMVQFCKDHYQCKRSLLPKYKKKDVVRRTLSPIVPHQLTYSTKTDDLQSFCDKSLECREKNLKRGFHTPDHKMYREMGLRTDADDGKEIEGRALFINHVSKGLKPEEVELIEDMEKKRTAPGLLGRAPPTPSMIKSMKAHIRHSCKKSTAVPTALTALRQTNTALHEGTKRMYELLHETEHRLLVVQAGGSYMTHVKACKKRRKMDKKLKENTHETNHKQMNPIPPYNPISLSKMRSDARLGLRAAVSIKDVALSANFTERFGYRKQRQLFFDKLGSVYTVLCTILNMKQPKMPYQSIPYHSMKKLRADPFPTTSVSLHNPVIKKKKSTRRAVVSPIQVSKPVLNKKAVSSGKSNLVMKKHKVLPRIGGDKVNKPSGKVAAVKPDKKKQLAIPSPPKAGNSKSSVLSSGRLVASSSRRSTRSAQISVPRCSRVSRLSYSKPPQKVKANASVRSVPRSVRHCGTRSHHKYNRTGSPRDTAGHAEMFDPATITWEEFVKWGNKETTQSPQKEKKMRFASGSKPRPAQSENKNRTRPPTPSSASSEDLARLNLGYSRSTIAVQKSLSVMWKIMRKSFVKVDQDNTLEGSSRTSMSAKDSEVQHQLFTKLGMDKSNPVNHIKLNWLSVKVRGNKMLIRETNQRLKEAGANYRSMIHSTEFNDTSLWTHKWTQNFQARRRSVELKRADQFIEWERETEWLWDSVEVLNDEAKRLNLTDNIAIQNLIHKIKLVCSDDRVKYLSLFRGQAKMQCIVMSLPAFETCTLQMQAAMQFVMVEVLQGETDMLLPMFQQRGLPLHPGIAANATANAIDDMPVPTKMKVNDYVNTNKVLSSVPPAKPGLSRNLIKNLEKNVIYEYI